MWKVDPYLFPARGRKRIVTFRTAIADNVDPYLFPARGRKQGLDATGTRSLKREC